MSRARENWESLRLEFEILRIRMDLSGRLAQQPSMRQCSWQNCSWGGEPRQSYPPSLGALSPACVIESSASQLRRGASSL